MDKAAEQRVRNLLGMAQRARRVVSGSVAVEQAVKDGTAKLLLLAEDAEESTKKNYERLAEKYHIPWRVLLTRESMGASMGKEYRAAAALLDEGFSKSLCRMLGEYEN